jgi:chitin disaccharide deacetylase
MRKKLDSKKFIVICADDYAFNESVSDGILSLAHAERLSATSVMSLSSNWPEYSIKLLQFKGKLNVGLHLDWTSQFAVNAGLSQGLTSVMLRSFRRKFDTKLVRKAIELQLDSFELHWHDAPDHIDGHQHIHQFDGVREVLCDILIQRYGTKNNRPWLRISKTNNAGFKGAVISWMGAKQLNLWAESHKWPKFRELLGVNSYDGTVDDYERRMRNWLKLASVAKQPCLIMCHPGLYSDNNDPIGEARPNEFSFLSSNSFLKVLREANLNLALGEDVKNLAHLFF